LLTVFNGVARLFEHIHFDRLVRGADRRFKSLLAHELPEAQLLRPFSRSSRSGEESIFPGVSGSMRRRNQRTEDPGPRPRLVPGVVNGTERMYLLKHSGEFM